MRQRGADTLGTEEPDEFIAHVRVYGGLARQPPALPGSRPPTASAALPPLAAAHRQRSAAELFPRQRV
jgi:hypothetical protein